MTDEDRRYVLDAFTFWATCGYHGDELLDEIDDRLADLDGSPDPAFRAQLADRVREALAAQRAREAEWTEETVNDRIDEAFDELWDRGIVALQHAGYTTSDGWEDVAEAAADVEEPRGAVFWHGQDTERGARGEGLWLAFGAFEQGDGHGAASVGIGREVVAVLGKNGVPTEWDGSVQTRIRVLPFPWRKRQFTEAP